HKAYLVSMSAAEGSLRANACGAARDHLAQCEPDSRGWEWDHLNLASDTSLDRWKGLGAAVRNVAFSFDESQVFLGSQDRGVRVWDWNGGPMRLNHKTDTE